MMTNKNIFIQATRRIAILGVMLVCALAVLAEDVTFMTNRRQWEKLPTATLMQMGNDFMNVKNLPDSGMLAYSIIANRYNENLKGEELEQCIRAIKHTGTIYADHYSNYAEAYKQLLKAQDLAEKHHYNEFLPDIYMSMGSIYWLQEGLRHDNQQYKEALAYNKKAFWAAIEHKRHDMITLIIINLNFVAFSRDKLAQFANERETYSHLPIPDSSDLKFMAQAMNTGVQLISKGQSSLALEVFRHALAENDKTNILNKVKMEVMLNEYICKTLLSMGRDKEALTVLEHEKEIVQNNLPSLIPGIWGQFAEYYSKHNNQMLADKYELLWLHSSDSIAQATQANNVNTMRFLHEIDKMNEEQKAMTLKQKHDRQMLWVVSGFLLLALVLLTLLAINRSRIKQKNRVLYENNVALLAADEQRRRLAEQEEKARIDAEAAKYGAIRMDEQSTEELWQNIIHVMEYSQEIFDENFSVARLAELIGAKPNYVSQAINQQPDWTFPTLLAHYRIREACRRMNDTARYGNYTVEGLGQSVGFTSRSYFVKLFKKHIGLTPSDYMKQRR